MKIKYRVLFDDPVTAARRIFVRDVENWPFPNLPAAGDAVAIDSPARRTRISGEGDSLSSKWEPGDLLEPRPVRRVVYLPSEQTALIDMDAPALSEDPAPQIAILLEAGFREVTPKTPGPPQYPGRASS